jgi:hypothetical protein
MTLSPEEVKKEHTCIQKNIKKWDKALEELQHTCTHPNQTISHKANTGNYDPTQDCYWTVHKCPDCGLYWTQEQ